MGVVASLGGWRKKFVLFKDIPCYSKWTGLIKCISSHNRSNHLGLISSNDPGAKWHLWKHFKSMSREHCVASRHAEKTCTALRAIEAGLLQQCAMHAAHGSDCSYTTSGLHWRLLVAGGPPPQGGSQYSCSGAAPVCNYCVHTVLNKLHSCTQEFDCTDRNWCPC